MNSGNPVGSWGRSTNCYASTTLPSAFTNSPGFHSPIELTANWSYTRLHGPGGKYQGNYTNKVLRTWANRIVEWSTQLKSIYVYFDNDQAGFAASNALTLKQLVAERLATPNAA